MKDLIISAPNQGIGPSPITGYGNVVNLDIYTIPGVARLNNLLAKKSSTTVVGTIQWMVKNPATPAEVYALDDGGNVYKSSDSGDTWALMTGFTAGGHGNGLAIWKNYLIVARDAFLDVCGDGTATGITNANWTNSWKAIDSDVLWHPMIVSYNDGILYGGAGKYMFSLEELTTFVPATGATFDFVTRATLLPSNYRIKCLAELGGNIMIGTWMGTSITDFKVANVYPWDTGATVSAPLEMNENGVNSMLTINNSLYMQVGIEGKVYRSNGVQAVQIAQIPSSITDIEGGLYLEPFPGAIMNYKGRPFFGVSSGGSGATAAGMGIWSIQQNAKGNTLNYEHQISTLSDGSSSTVKIGALLPFSRDTMLVGWKDASTYGVDKTTNTSRYTSYSGYFESPFYNVGTPLVKRMFNKGEFQLTKALTTGQGVKIKYRTDLSSSFTTIGTYDFATLAGVLSHNFVADIPACEFVQIRCELTTGSSSNTSPQIKQITLR